MNRVTTVKTPDESGNYSKMGTEVRKSYHYNYLRLGLLAELIDCLFDPLNFADIRCCALFG